MRVLVLAPIMNSLYSRLVVHLCSIEPGIVVTDVVVRTPWTMRRVRTEFERDGVRLLKKTIKKMILGDRAYDTEDPDTLLAFARAARLPGRSLRNVARKRDIAMTVVGDHNDAKSLATLARAQPDVIIFTGGGLIREHVLRIPRLGVLNCHMGLLPAYRGMDVVEWPVAEDKLLRPDIGLSLHFMDEGVDTGPILLQYRLPLRAGDTFASIRSRLEPKMVELILNGVRGLRDGTLSASKQAQQEGRQYYLMHPRMMSFAESKLRRVLEAPQHADTGVKGENP